MTVEISRGHNPLRDPEDHRLNRIAGPSALVIFGVTGDLSRKKLMPAVYDLANRGLLPPGFALVGFARRDWEDQDFAQVVKEAVETHSRTEFREETWQQLLQGIRFVSGEFDDPDAFRRLRETVDKLDVERGTMGNHAFYLSIPPKDFPHRRRAAEVLRPGGRHRRSAGALAPRRDREAVRARPRLGAVAQRRAAIGVPDRLDLPHRPLPRQGDGPEHPGAALRERAVRADLERELRRPRADHDGRGHRRGRPRRLLRRHRRRARRHPEPPAAAHGAHRDGRADLVRREEPARREGEGARRGHPAEGSRTLDRTGSVRRRVAGRREGARLPRRRRDEPGVDDRDLRRDHARSEHASLGRSAVLPADGKAPRPACDRDRGRVQARPRAAVLAHADHRARARTRS